VVLGQEIELFAANQVLRYKLPRHSVCGTLDGLKRARATDHAQQRLAGRKRLHRIETDERIPRLPGFREKLVRRRFVFRSSGGTSRWSDSGAEALRTDTPGFHRRVAMKWQPEARDRVPRPGGRCRCHSAARPWRLR
jgi:hypothetical protein